MDLGRAAVCAPDKSAGTFYNLGFTFDLRDACQSGETRRLQNQAGHDDPCTVRESTDPGMQ